MGISREKAGSLPCPKEFALARADSESSSLLGERKLSGEPNATVVKGQAADQRDLDIRLFLFSFF